jgi:para-nitrobenzyl esterase
VAANAAAFGGDAAKVTLIGQSSGGTSILAHLAAPKSWDLFRAAISLSASPNVSLSNAQKEAQDAARWLPHTPCANRTRGAPVLACLRAASVDEVQGALEAPYDFFDFESTFADEPVPPGAGIGGPPGAARWSALMHVDGVSIANDSLAAARAGYPAALLLQSLDGELDYDPAPELATLSRAAVRQLVEKKLSRFGARAEALYAMYADLGGDNETLAAAPAYALDADQGITCGSLDHALAAGAARRSRGGGAVYLSHVTSRPHHPLHAPYGATCDLPCKYAFHLWDWVAID